MLLKPKQVTGSGEGKKPQTKPSWVLPRKAGSSLGRAESDQPAPNSQHQQDAEVPPLGPYPLLGSFPSSSRNHVEQLPVVSRQQQNLRAILQWTNCRNSIQYCFLPLSTPVDSQENTAILLRAMPNGNEPLGAQPRLGGGPGREAGMGKTEETAPGSIPVSSGGRWAGWSP